MERVNRQRQTEKSTKFKNRKENAMNTEQAFDNIERMFDELINIADLVKLMEEGEEIYIKTPDIDDTKECFEKALTVLKTATQKET